ncbi:hypothetical protein [Rossellomorea aquimaris]
MIEYIESGTAFTVEAANTLRMVKKCAWIISGILS